MSDARAPRPAKRRARSLLVASAGLAAATFGVNCIIGPVAGITPHHPSCGVADLGPCPGVVPYPAEDLSVADLASDGSPGDADGGTD